MNNKVTELTIRFPFPVDIPEGVLEMLDTLAAICCRAYGRGNPTRVMWPSGSGGEIQWECGEYAGCDMSKSVIECAEREDYYGGNPLNPDGARLRKEALEARLKARARS